MADDRDAASVDRSEGDVNISPLRTAWQQKNLDDATRKLLDEDERYFLRQSLSSPCLNALRSCGGIWIEDLQGRRYMDFHGNSVHLVGFSHPAVIEAVKKQLDDLSFCARRYTNRVAVDLAKKLTEIAPAGLDKVLFAPGGTSAIGIALKLARIATGRHKTISMWDSFHGASLDAISIGGEALFRRDVGPLMTGAAHVPPCECYHCLWGCSGPDGCNLQCARYLDYVLDHEGDVAAVIAEPIRATPYVPAPGYWKAVRDACDRHGALLIFDEICQGFGRTGRMFACENFGVVPDILVVGKGLGGAVFPMAAVVTRADFDVAGDRALGHYTHEKSPVGCAAALATIRVIEEEGLVENAREQGAYALGRMREMMDRHALIGDVRGVGLLMGMEFVRDRETKERAVEQAERLMYEALGRGLSFKLTMGSIATLAPPLAVTRDEMDRALDILDKCIGVVS